MLGYDCHKKLERDGVVIRVTGGHHLLMHVDHILVQHMLHNAMAIILAAECWLYVSASIEDLVS